MHTTPILFVIFLSSQISASPVFLPRLARFAGDEVDTASNASLPARAPAVLALLDNSRFDALAEIISNLITETGDRMRALRDKARCVQNSVTSAGQLAAQDLAEVRSCTLKAADTVATNISPLSSQLQKDLVSLANIYSTLLFDWVKCYTTGNRTACRAQALRAAEVSLDQVASSIRSGLSTSADQWTLFADNLRTCFINGAEQVTSAELELRQQILQCIA